MFDKKIKDEFWTTFGKYMALHPSASADKVNWINYKTGVKLVQFRLEVNEKKAGIYIELSKANLEVQKKLFDQLTRDIDLLIDYTDANWKLESQLKITEGRIVSRIFQECREVNVYFKSDWPAIISFLKFELIGLDKFWTEQKDIYAFIADS
ncbi:DUF4268 domain-containing protein [Flavitalea sp.]|nr:DUF4268 domain-containing protein [Flavitalea sp.]